MGFVAARRSKKAYPHDKNRDNEGFDASPETKSRTGVLYSGAAEKTAVDTVLEL